MSRFMLSDDEKILASLNQMLESGGLPAQENLESIAAMPTDPDSLARFQQVQKNRESGNRNT